MSKVYTICDRNKALALRDQGIVEVEIARILDFPVAEISESIRQYDLEEMQKRRDAAWTGPRCKACNYPCYYDGTCPRCCGDPDCEICV